MSNSLVRGLKRTLGTFAAAARAADAVENHRSPRARDLKALAIDPAVFRDIRF